MSALLAAEPERRLLAGGLHYVALGVDSAETQTSLMLTLHLVKRFIGRTEKGFDFLGYKIHPNRKLRPSRVSLHRLTERARQLYEREASIKRLWQYVIRWHRWLHGGLDGMVSTSMRPHNILGLCPDTSEHHGSHSPRLMPERFMTTQASANRYVKK